MYAFRNRRSQGKREKSNTFVRPVRADRVYMKTAQIPSHASHPKQPHSRRHHPPALSLPPLLRKATISLLQNLIVIRLESQQSFSAEFLVAELGLVFKDESYFVPATICAASTSSSTRPGGEGQRVCQPNSLP
jgi:hypothetical protein